MCGIVGYVGKKHNIFDVLLGGLESLEYRGYDSAGVGYIQDDAIKIVKSKGRIKNLKKIITNKIYKSTNSNIGIGHTRWATHGGATDVNAHPHISENIAVVHNGIIENYSQIKSMLSKKGYKFLSDTDTEAVAHLLNYESKKAKIFENAIIKTVKQLKGAFVILILNLNSPDEIYAIRKDSPLIIGEGENENFFASDISAISKWTEKVIAVENESIIKITDNNISVKDFNGKSRAVKSYLVDLNSTASDKGHFDTFMEKEIYEQPLALEKTLNLHLSENNAQIVFDKNKITPAFFKNIESIVIVGCGTAYYAGLVIKDILEKYVQVPVRAELAHEFRYSNPIIMKKILVLGVSQSGETMDTIKAVEFAKKNGAKVVSIVNSMHSTLSRMSDSFINTNAGLEVAVASTKAFTTQIMAGFLISLHISFCKKTFSLSQVKNVISKLKDVPKLVNLTLKNNKNSTKNVASLLKTKRSFMFLGKNIGVPIALEGSLKLKEISYIHSEGLASGELKHGPIALINKGFPVVVVVPDKEKQEILFNKVVSTIEEIKSRGALVIAVCPKNSLIKAADYTFVTENTDVLFYPFLTVLPLQQFALQIALQKKLDVDKPRNLAKSVTVE